MSLFISFEGGEGSGKTTQINKLAETLTLAGKKVLTTREPGGTDEGEKIREFIVQREGGEWSALSEALLIYAARDMHVQRLIRPALEEDKIVITDRFYDSTFVYQGYGRGLDLDSLSKINDIVLKGLKPDITFVLDIDSEQGLTRSQRRLASEQLGVDQTEDRFERLALDFHQKIRDGFLDIANKEPERCHVIDASQSIEDMAAQIKKIVMARLEAQKAA